jgi:ATP-dependent DNA helicase RecQ
MARYRRVGFEHDAVSRTALSRRCGLSSAMPDIAARMAEARRELKAAYGYDDFRPLQKRVVQSILAGRDTLAVLPTGGGKSICFQIPALVLGGVTIVISPLLALMQDQVGALQRRGVGAETLNSLISAEDSAAIMRRLADGAIRLLYVSPERAERLATVLADSGIRPAMLAIDEAVFICRRRSPLHQRMGP